ncbi:peptide ABC transporter ATP-binding protein [Asanoa ishikariensis]|uniref:Peptide/nickel transport system ATP-binding protein/oligopeptide transport system ATP-binding protein n=1 Tax=Asanoa ishikariensis TaxID=137265 RepID=A0A1H3RU98_9ACTN|nr:ABC transporter ATP-binding protein [Asanoa ishikariensis]GIF66813.1 peptide ABC transporter ATP-binding protein [Asanoa ishikariensis]SDZ29266.1 peptide/nickel transport system ATP-binding protein/oligopeptide transport system ATP-binding protein [Asanoa ishikariensis]
MTTEPLLRISELTVDFPGGVRAARGVSLDVHAGETLAVVGESGSGKSVTALSVLRLLPEEARVTAGVIEFDGVDLLSCPPRRLNELRGGAIGMVYQDPLTALNPVLPIGRQIEEAIQRHLGLRRRAATRRAAELLDLVGIPQAARRLRDYPHQFSGGMRQRVVIAMSISCDPRLIIADEPTTALDVTMQAQILHLLRRLRDDLGTSLMVISHDVGVVAGLADRVAIMYAGRVVESGSAADVIGAPNHPYGRGLLASVPRLDARARTRFAAIPGTPPDPTALPDGCAFAPRCRHVVDRCRDADPPLLDAHGGRLVACWRHAELAEVTPEPAGGAR